MGRPLYINKLGKKPPMCSEDHRDSEKYEWFKCIFRRISKWIWHEESCRLWKCLTQWDLPIFRFSSYWWFKIKSDTGLWVWFRIRLESQGTFGPWRRFSLYRVHSTSLVWENAAAWSSRNVTWTPSFTRLFISMEVNRWTTEILFTVNCSFKELWVVNSFLLNQSTKKYNLVS